MKKHLKLTILGSGSSGGVPRANGDWGVCDPSEPKNRRTRCSLLVQYWETPKGEGPDTKIEPPKSEQTIVLIDTSPDLREQFIAAKIRRLDAVIYTHDHADQTHGIDDLRAISYTMRARIPVHMDALTHKEMQRKFGYCFEIPQGRDHPAILEHMPRLIAGQAVTIDGPGGALDFLPVLLSHGNAPSLGFRFGPAAYAPDVHEIAPDSLDALHGVELLIIDALRYHAHPTHAHADRALTWIAQTTANKAVLTNLHIDMDYATLGAELFGPHEVA
jgi:phosphoribosyl 1,2-cyclic phosphate phosphodiesterase